MQDFFRWLFFNVGKDSRLQYHKCDCSLRNTKFTVIKNNAGLKLWDGQIKYCPVCGEKLDRG